MAAISRNTHMCVTYHGQTIILAKPSTYEELMNAVREGFALCHHAGLTLMVKSPLDGDDEEMELPESARDSLSAMTLTEIIVDECLMGCGQGFGDEDDWGQDLSETEMAAEALQWDRALRSRGSLPPGEGLPLNGPQYPANPQLSSNSEHPAQPPTLYQCIPVKHNQEASIDQMIEELELEWECIEWYWIQQLALDEDNASFSDAEV